MEARSSERIVDMGLEAFLEKVEHGIKTYNSENYGWNVLGDRLVWDHILLLKDKGQRNKESVQPNLLIRSPWC